MRTAFIEQLVEEAKTNDKIFLIVGDLGFNVVEPFRDQFSDRFLNVGIDEQNMVGVACGLSMLGYNVYIYSIANFPTLRCMEQIRYDVAYHNANVKIVSVGAGYAYGSLGASHHATEDMGMMRTIPNMVVCSPGDPVEARAVTKFSATYQGPMYLRLGKAGEKRVHGSEIVKFNLGDICSVREGFSCSVLVMGAILSYVNDFIIENKIDVALYSCPFVKPINSKQLKKIICQNRKVITIEEHQASAGFGSAILESINDLMQKKELEYFPDVKRIAIPDKFFYVSGTQAYLRKEAGLIINKSIFDE